MDKATTVAIAKGIKKSEVEEASKGLAVGEYDINAYVHIRGSIKKGKDKEQTVHMNIPYGKLVLALLSKVNAQTREKTIGEAIKAMESLTEEDELSIKEVVQGSWERLTEKAKQTTAGKVTTKLTFEVISPELASLTEVKEGVEA